jgi:hypothetical protein
LKEVLLREWTRLGGKMGALEARKAVGRERDGSNAEGVSGEWGEKVERVFEFLVDTGGLRRRLEKGVEANEGGHIVEMEIEGSNAGTSTPVLAVEDVEKVNSMDVDGGVADVGIARGDRSTAMEEVVSAGGGLG